MCLKNVPGLAKKNIKIQNMTNITTSILHCSGTKKSKNKNTILLILAKKLKRLIFFKKTAAVPTGQCVLKGQFRQAA